MKVSTEELRRATLTLLRHLEEVGATEIDIAEDFYWDVPSDTRYDKHDRPTELEMGQRSEDWS